MQVDLLRHGEPNGGGRYWGSIDVALSAEGWRQMQRSVAGRCWDLIVTSPLRRCAAFAAALAQERSLPYICDADLREMNFGEWQGLRAAEIMQSDALTLQQFWADPTSFAPPGGEAFGEFQRRVLEAWHRIATLAATARVLAISHGGPIRLLWAMHIEPPPPNLLALEVPYGALVCLDGTSRPDAPR